MTPLYQEQIPAPMAWRGGDFTKEQIAFDLTASQVAALEEILGRVERAGLSMREIGPEHVRHPALDAPPANP